MHAKGLVKFGEVRNGLLKLQGRSLIKLPKFSRRLAKSMEVLQEVTRVGRLFMVLQAHHLV